MATCDRCGNDYAHTFTITKDDGASGVLRLVRVRGSGHGSAVQAQRSQSPHALQKTDLSYHFPSVVFSCLSGTHFGLRVVLYAGHRRLFEDVRAFWTRRYFTTAVI